MSGSGSTGNVVAAVCSVFVPGLGQLVQGRLFSAIFYFATVSILYATGLLSFLGVVFHVFSVLSAAVFRSS